LICIQEVRGSNPLGSTKMEARIAPAPVKVQGLFSFLLTDC
jgi:hypothetical protein